MHLCIGRCRLFGAHLTEARRGYNNLKITHSELDRFEAGPTSCMLLDIGYYYQHGEAANACAQCVCPRHADTTLWSRFVVDVTGIKRFLN